MSEFNKIKTAIWKSFSYFFKKKKPEAVINIRGNGNKVNIFGSKK